MILHKKKDTLNRSCCIMKVTKQTANLPPANAQNPDSSHRKTDTLLLVPLAQMRSSIYGNLGSSALARVLVAVNASLSRALPAGVCFSM